uniref:Uncharacterized protein n=1 Tax=Oryza meridionalis TaxID=40149 RepID=A0A0E0CK85_9ORYZ
MAPLNLLRVGIMVLYSPPSTNLFKLVRHGHLPTGYCRSTACFSLAGYAENVLIAWRMDLFF